MNLPPARNTLVACPDARPPAYQAVIGLDQAGLLDRFLTGAYYRGTSKLLQFAGRLAPKPWAKVERVLNRRRDAEIPSERVEAAWGFDAAIQLENRLSGRWSSSRRRVARWRTRHFDRILAGVIKRRRPGTLFAFSDVASEFSLPLCRDLGIPSILSMVHGDVREEKLVLEREAECSPDFFPIYLGDGVLDPDELDWLHQRRLRDLEFADRILVPSDHIANTLARYGTPRQRIEVVPYAADTRRFLPDPAKIHDSSCTFLFAGGITQRKGIKYLLEAWREIKRPGWRLQLLGALPKDERPLEGYLDDVEVLGRVGHSEMPGRMAQADVFVFPSLFEGSAVVTYEALACGLPSIVTPEAGSVVRDGSEGFIVPSGDSLSLAAAMERLGSDAELRAQFAGSARERSLAFDWPRYHASVLTALSTVIGEDHVNSLTRELQWN
ncbi:glycosyltransferase family 4 protein [Singulisphaera sp. PoT]|uniref:glycosyltransferase family 4 protein n=1 Tax=Singulisphaera sp. PoT TaxID=3411797 RepID=UPI003BF529C5